MSLDDAFLQDILEHPEEDAQRLIYADWLDERGDPASAARAEFIRTQLEMERLVHDYSREGSRRRKQLRHRERQLLARQRKLWLGSLYGVAETYYFRRGLLDEVRFKADQFLAHAASLSWPQTLRTVHVSLSWTRWGPDPSGALHDLLACPQLCQVTDLDLYNGQLLEENLHRLATSPHLTRLRVLILRFNGIDAAGARALTASVSWPALRRLDLGSNSLRDEGAEVLAQATCFPALKELILTHNGIGNRGAEALASSPSLRSLELLDLSGNAIPFPASNDLRARFGTRLRGDLFEDEIPF